jgi:hypothetical protein
MARFGVIFLIVEIAFMIFSLVDVFLTEKWRIRGVPRFVWAVIVILLPLLGGVLWWWIGKEPVERVQGTSRSFGAPDDDPRFLSQLSREEEQNERIRKLEQELRDLDDDPPK